MYIGVYRIQCGRRDRKLELVERGIILEGEGKGSENPPDKLPLPLHRELSWTNRKTISNNVNLCQLFLSHSDLSSLLPPFTLYNSVL